MKIMCMKTICMNTKCMNTMFMNTKGICQYNFNHFFYYVGFYKSCEMQYLLSTGRRKRFVGSTFRY